MDDDLRRFYERYDEHGRLLRSDGLVEMARTQEVVLRALPPAPARIADIGGGPGRYAAWLAELGYSVVLRDLMPHHVETAREVCAGLDVDIDAGDARAVDLPDESVDAVLLLGPLYHLRERSQRIAALREAARIVRPGGPVFAAVISRWAPFLDGGLVKRLYDRPGFAAILEGLQGEDGYGPPLFDGDFSGYFHRPDEIREEIAESGLELVDLVGLEGVSFALSDVEERFGDERLRHAMLDVARRIERVPELMGLSPHLLATARRPGSGAAPSSATAPAATSASDA